MIPKFEDASLLPKQYVISKEIPAEFKDWKVQEFGGWSIASSKELPAIDLYDANDTHIGCLVGWAIHEQAMLADCEKVILKDGISQHFFEKLCGRFILVYGSDGKTFVKSDASALLPLVFSTNIKAAASTPTALIPWKGLEIDPDIQAAFDIPNRRGWYPFGLTAFKGVRRLMANHRLCLDTWKVDRYWPINEDGTSAIPVSQNPKQATIEIAKIVQSHVGVIAKGGHGIAHLTAGYDTRMVLAATKPHRDNFSYETVTTFNLDKKQNLDSFIAGQIAKKTKINHKFVDFVEPTEKEVTDWLNRTGYCIKDEVTELAATAKQNDRNYFSLSGVCAEVGRAYYWSREPERDKDVTPEAILTTLYMPKIPKTNEAARKWIDGLPVKGGCLFWDIVLIEQRQGCWGGANILGHDVAFPSFSPFNSHEIYQLMLSLPEEYRASQQFARDFISYLWPELLKFPFNRPGGLAKLKYVKAEISAILPNSVVTRIKRVLKKLKS